MKNGRGCLIKEFFKKTLSASGQKGMALVTVLLVSGLVSIMSISMISRQQIEIRRTSNMLDSDQSLVLGQGVEAWGRRILAVDGKDNSSDHLAEPWALGLPPTEVEGGMVAGLLEDMQGRFNINNLVAQDPEFRNFSKAQFERLLDYCEIEMEVAEKVMDWLDLDSDPHPFGAEDPYYENLELPYRAANYRMVSPTELMLVAGVDTKGYGCLAPYITALPEATQLNINTASAEVLASLSDSITLQAAQELVDGRPEEGYESVALFLAEPAIAGSALNDKYLTLTSTYFLGTAQVSVGKGETLLYTLFNRVDQKVDSIFQSVGVY